MASLRGLVLPLLLTVLPVALAAPPAEQAGRQTIEVFVRDGCPHCGAAKAFLAGLAAGRPELRIVLRPVDRDAAAREDLLRISRQAGVWPPGVPTFVIGERVLVGFDAAGRTGAELVALLDRQALPVDALETGLFGTLSVERLGLPLFTLALGLLDGFNPCAMWLLLFLLSLLVRLHDRRRMALVAGTFVLSGGAVYYAFLAAWLNLFLLLGVSTTLTRLLGGLALLIGALNLRDGLRPGGVFALSIPAAARPGLYVRLRVILQAGRLLPALAGVAVLAVLVNVVELLCTAGFPALYTAILARQDLSPAAHYAYLGLYVLGYLADDLLMVAGALLALGGRRLSERAGRWLKLLSGAVMLALGGVMLLRPGWLG